MVGINICIDLKHKHKKNRFTQINVYIGLLSRFCEIIKLNHTVEGLY